MTLQRTHSTRTGGALAHADRLLLLGRVVVVAAERKHVLHLVLLLHLDLLPLALVLDALLGLARAGRQLVGALRLSLLCALSCPLLVLETVEVRVVVGGGDVVVVRAALRRRHGALGLGQSKVALLRREVDRRHGARPRTRLCGRFVRSTAGGRLRKIRTSRAAHAAGRAACCTERRAGRRRASGRAAVRALRARVLEQDGGAAAAALLDDARHLLLVGLQLKLGLGRALTLLQRRLERRRRALTPRGTGATSDHGVSSRAGSRAYMSTDRSSDL